MSLLLTLVAGVGKGLMLLVAYVSNNTFPMPLKEKEEQIYLEKLKQGDEQARSVLIERNLRLVAHIVKKFDNTGEDVDDLISIGTIGLIKAINTFDGNKKIRLATYSARCIENAIRSQRLWMIQMIRTGLPPMENGIRFYVLTAIRIS